MAAELGDSESLPRTRGDEPTVGEISESPSSSAPHPRG